jgi:hypothetical protein
VIGIEAQIGTVLGNRPLKVTLVVQRGSEAVMVIRVVHKVSPRVGSNIGALGFYTVIPKIEDWQNNWLIRRESRGGL